MTRCRFLIDECVPAAVARGLRRRLAEVSVVQIGEPEAPAKGASDETLLDYCSRDRRILVTADRATMPNHIGEILATGGHTAGVLIIDLEQSLSHVLDDLCLIYEASEQSEWTDILFYLPLRR